jgi:uncharacterized protein YggE
MKRDCLEIELARQAFICFTPRKISMKTIFFALVLATTASAEPGLLDSTAHIHVTGTARAEAPPDKIDIILEVATMGASIEESMKDNASRLAAALDAAKSAGIASADVQLSAVSVNQREEYENTGSVASRSTRVRYSVNKTLVVCLRNTAKLDALLIDFSKAKVLVTRIEFVSLALAKSNETLMLKAIENARANAEQMAKMVGAKIGRALLMAPTATNARQNNTMNAYSTGGGVSVGGAATGALVNVQNVEVDFELISAK